jgi:hypothetical protein
VLGIPSSAFVAGYSVYSVEHACECPFVFFVNDFFTASGEAFGSEISIRVVLVLAKLLQLNNVFWLIPRLTLKRLGDMGIGVFGHIERQIPTHGIL